MDNTIPCAVVRDLLPLYAEQMLSPETTALVEAHLADCPDCAAACARMADAAVVPVQPEHRAEVKPLRRFRWQLLLNILGAPLWLPLAVALAATAFALYATLWATVIALWALPVTLGATALGLLALTVLALSQTEVAAALLLVGAILVCAGLTILFTLACLWLTRGFVRLTARVCRKLFSRRKEAHA